jgi:predicted nucleic acid-binding Zn finger protein
MSENKMIDVTVDGVEMETAEVLTGRGFITGKSGSGKSNTAGVVCEELLRQKMPILIVDTDGEYYGLKEEFEILHVGADEECDLQVGVEHAEKIAELSLMQNIPIILDVSGYLEQEEAELLIKNVLQHLFAKEKKAKKPFLVLVEEIHEWIPEQGSTGCSKMLTRVAKRGRKRGLGIAGISQRPAEVDKNFITQCNWRVWHKLDWDNDLKVVGRVLGKDYKETVSSLDVGEAVLEAGFLEESKLKVKFKRKQTFDAGETPDLESFERPELKSVSEDLVEELEEISEQQQQRQERVKSLQDELEERQERIAELEEELERAQDMTDMAEQFTQALTASGGESDQLQEKVDEIREEKENEIRRLKKENSQLREKVDELEELEEQQEEIEKMRERVEQWEKDKEIAQEAITRLADVLGLNVDGDVEKYRSKVKSLRERVERLKKQLEKAEQEGESVREQRFEDAAEFLEDDVVKKYVEKAADSVAVGENHFWRVLTVIAQEGEAQKSDLTPVIDLHKSNIGKALRAMDENKVLVSEGKPKTYRLNKDGISEIKELNRKRERIRSKAEELKGE